MLELTGTLLGLTGLLTTVIGSALLKATYDEKASCKVPCLVLFTGALIGILGGTLAALAQ